MAALMSPQCADFSQFQDVLKKMRQFDDTIIYALNVQLPTESFSEQKNCQQACKEFFEKLVQNASQREQAISKCIEFYGRTVSELKTKKEKDESNIGLLKELRKEQNKLRLLQTEQGVEEIIRERTNKVFYERCRAYYVPDNFRQ